jgi:hypothetical protein
MTRLGLHIHSVGLAEQSGVMPSHECVDATVILKIALQSLKASNQEVHSICYVRRLGESFRFSSS